MPWLYSTKYLEQQFLYCTCLLSFEYTCQLQQLHKKWELFYFANLVLDLNQNLKYHPYYNPLSYASVDKPSLTRLEPFGVWLGNSGVVSQGQHGKYCRHHSVPCKWQEHIALADRIGSDGK